MVTPVVKIRKQMTNLMYFFMFYLYIKVWDNLTSSWYWYFQKVQKQVPLHHPGRQLLCWLANQIELAALKAGEICCSLHLCTVKWFQSLWLEMMWGVISTALVQDTARVMAALMVSNCTNMKWAELVEVGSHKLFEVWGYLLSLFIIPVLGVALMKNSVYFKLFPLSEQC